MSEITIRTPTRKDIELAYDLFRRTSGSERYEEWQSALNSYLGGSPDDWVGRDPLFARVAEVEGKVVGLMLMNVITWELGRTKSGWIDILAVDPDYRGKGVGRRMAESLFDYFKSKGIERVYTTARWDDVELISFLRRRGFDRSVEIILKKELREA